MVLLTLTAAGKAAVDEFCRLKKFVNEDEERRERLSSIELGSPIDHNDLVNVSQYLVKRNTEWKCEPELSKKWRLDTLLKGAVVYQPPPTPKPEPTSEYKALMRQLRQEEEQRQYEQMLYPPPAKETFNQRFPNVGSSSGAAPLGANAEEDEITYADINRQMALIINVLVSIIACSIAIWIAARRWEVHKRLALSMFGSGLVAFAEVAIYLGYIRRIKDARVTERAKLEKKEVVETWVIEGKKGGSEKSGESVRFRKGKHR